MGGRTRASARLPSTMRSRRKLRTLGTLYGLAHRELSEDRLLFSSFLLAALAYAAGHALTSLAAGLLAKTLLVGGVTSSGWGPLSLTLVGLVSASVKGGAAVWTATAKARMAHRVGNSVRGALAKNLLSQGAARKGPEIVARTALRIREVERGVDEGLLAFGQSAAQLVPLLGVLVVLSPKLALGSVLVLAPFGAGLALARRSWRSSHLRAMGLAERLHREVDELVRHIDVFRTYGAGPRLEAELSRLGERAGHMSARAESGRAALSSANEVLAAAGLLVVVLLSPHLGLENTGESLVPFAAVLFMSYRPLRDLGDARSAMLTGALAIESLEELTAPVADDEPLAASERLSPFPLAELVVEGIGSKRDSARTSFFAAPGEVVAIVGPTGSGKTTLLRALLGLEPDSVGSIRYGCEELCAASVGPSARPFAWVPQDAPVFTGTLTDNILLAGQDPESAHAALVAMGAERLDRECGDEWLGAGGRPVSGGERRLIGLARAIAQGAPVLLLDEPTEGLDELSEARVIAALAKLRGQRTVILVTHRKEPLRIADRVVRLGEPLSAERTTSRLP